LLTPVHYGDGLM